jgi:phage-related protein
MAFWGRNFIFDDIPSEEYSLIISSDDGEEGSSPATSGVELVTEEIFRRTKPYLYGVRQTPVLEIPVRFTTTEYELTQEDSSLAQQWLFGQQNYKILRILQEDMEDYYFNCFLTEPEVLRVGNIIRGFTATIVCDSPFAWGNTETYNYTFEAFPQDYMITLLNNSQDRFYTFPTVTFTLDGAGDHPSDVVFSITNVDDNNRTMAFTNLSTDETLTINCDLEIVTSSYGFKRISSMVSPIRFFRLINGVNHIKVSGRITALTFTTTPAKRIT